ncbi:MAG: DUF4174 domain-containing protein [Gemmobacter sp.]
MKPLSLIALAIVLPLAAAAQSAAPLAAAAPPAAPVVVSDAAEAVSDTQALPGWGPVDATTGVTLEEYLYRRRPIVVFADSPENPQFIQQMRLLEAAPGALEERDVIVITDTDPDARSAVRMQLRPRGFSLVLMDKDGSVALRRPSPRDMREIAAAIDKFPLRRQEMLEQRPAGR